MIRTLAPVVSLLCLGWLTAGQFRPAISTSSTNPEDVRRRLTQLKLDSFDVSDVGVKGAMVREIDSTNPRELGCVGAMVVPARRRTRSSSRIPHWLRCEVAAMSSKLAGSRAHSQFLIWTDSR